MAFTPEHHGWKVVLGMFIGILLTLTVLLISKNNGFVTFAFGAPVPIPQPAKIVRQYGTLNPDLFKQYIMSVNSKVYDRMADDYVEAIMDASQKYRISPVLIAAVAHTESEFNPFAVSKTNAEGAMQVQLNVWKDVLKEKGIIKDERDIYDPIIGIESGCFILRHYTDKTKDFSAALNKYLGDDHKPYRDKIARIVGEIVVMGITKEVDASYSLK